MTASLGAVIVGTRFGLILALAALALVVLERRRGTVTRFLTEESTALNLAVARVVVMGALLWDTRLGTLLDFAALDSALMVAPRGWAHIAPHVPLAVPVVIGAYVLLVAAAVLALVGVAGRAMCGLAAMTALYLHTIPQLFGKVNHTANHLVLFSALLAVAPCCDTLSIDAIRAAIRDAHRGAVRRLAPARAYAVALQTMMLYIGLAYFFPGAWKVARAGAGWFRGDNMRLLILSKLQEFPMSPLQYWVLSRSALLALMAAATIVFELGFVFAILDRRARPWAALVGVGFHEATAAMMGIWFAALQASYVVFIDWTRCLRWMAGRRHLGPITLRYAAGDLASRRLVGLVVAYDWLDLVHPVALAEDATPADAATPTHWAAVDASGALFAGRDAVDCAIAARIPLLWPLGAHLGARALRSLGGAGRGWTTRAPTEIETDAIPALPDSVTPALSPTLRYAAAGLLASFVLAGAAHAVRTWPVACYPTFDIVEPPYTTVLSVVARESGGGTRAWMVSFDPVMGRRFGTDRWRGLVATVLDTDHPFDPARARALLDTWRARHPDPGMQSVTFYRDTSPLTLDGPRTVVARRIIGALTIADPR